jgi:hypothetical protein
MKLPRGVIAAGVLAGVVALLGVQEGTGTTNGNVLAGQQLAAEDTLQSAVEDYQYPKALADATFTERGLRLKGGDGHIVYAKCGSEPGLLEVYSSNDRTDAFCFRVTGNSGYLNVELPRVYGVRANDYKVRVDMSVDDTQVSFDVNKNEWAGVGKLGDPQKRDHLLLEIVTTK